MTWIDWVFGITCAVAGAGMYGAYVDARYVKLPRATHEWHCPHCPMVFGATDKQALALVKDRHLSNERPGVHQ